MSPQETQAALLVRLRTARMENAARALAEAREVAAEAGRQADAAAVAAQAADARLGRDRQGLAADPGAAAARIALVDRSLFLQAVARSSASDAAETLRQRDAVEAEQRRSLLRARARLDGIAEQRRALVRRAELLREETAALDNDDGRRPA